MVDSMIALMGPLATWVLLLGVLPAATLIALMWTVRRVVDQVDKRLLASGEAVSASEG